jgi:hypothetical protein
MKSIPSAGPGPQRQVTGVVFQFRLLTGFVGSLMASGFAWKLGSGPLGFPPFRDASVQSVERWYAVRSPLEAALGFVRVATLATATISALFFFVAFVSALLISRPERHLQDFGRRIAIILPRPFRRWRDVAAGLSLSTALVVAPLTGSFASTTASATTTTTTVATAVPTSVPTSVDARRKPLGPIGPADLFTQTKQTERIGQVGTKRPPLSSGQRSQLEPFKASAQPRAVGDPTSGQQWPEVELPSLAIAAPESLTPVSTPAPTELPPTTEAQQRLPTLAAPTSSEPQKATTPASVPLQVRHTVSAGESFWSIAEDVVLRSRPDASEHDVNAYCAALIKANRAKLPDPTNPDVVLVGTVLVLVAAPSPRSGTR